jgi:ketosteroid isomerase-like protein
VIADDVETVSAALEGCNSGDFDRVGELLDPEFELVVPRSLLDAAPYHGRAGFGRFVRDVADDWTTWRVEPQELRDLGEGRVLVRARFRAHARPSGVGVTAPATWIVEVHDGLIRGVRVVSGRAESLEYLSVPA